MAQPLQMALQLGLQYAPLAAVAVNALERWELQPDALAVLAPRVVPLMEPYLRNLAALEGTEAVADASGGMPPIHWGQKPYLWLCVWSGIKTFLWGDGTTIYDMRLHDACR